MSIKAKNRLAAAAAVLAVLGMLAVIQFSATPSYIKRGNGVLADEGGRTKHARIMIDDNRLVEYQ